MAAQEKPTALLRIGRAHKDLALAIKKGDLKAIQKIRDTSKAVEAFVQAQKMNLSVRNDASELTLDCERGAGGLLAKMEKPRGGRGKKTSITMIGVSQNQATRWQQEATVPDREYREYCNKQRERREEITQYGLLSLAKQRRMPATSAPKPLKGQFDVIYADPPWKYGATTAGGRASQYYPTMETKAICTIPVKKHAAGNAVLFLWSTNAFLPDALEVMAAWGFEYKTNLCWVKDKVTSGLGVFLRGKHELLLIGTKGKMKPKHRPVSVIEATRRRHSEKPDEVYAIVEAMYPKRSCAEIFSRKERAGWKAYGNQILE